MEHSLKRKISYGQNLTEILDAHCTSFTCTMVHGIYMYMYYMHEYIFLIVQYLIRLLSKDVTIIIHLLIQCYS